MEDNLLLSCGSRAFQEQSFDNDRQGMVSHLSSSGHSYALSVLWVRQGPRLSIRIVIWILPSDTHSLVFISISHLSNLHISKQWDDKLCTLSLICRSLEWWRRKTDNSLRLQFHQVTEPPIGIFLNKRWTDSFEVSSFLWQGGIQGCTWLDQGASEIKW